MTKNKHEGDFLILIITIAISLFGVVMIFSSSYYVSLSKMGDPFYYLKDAIMWFCIGWVAFVAASLIDYHFFRFFAIPAIVVGFGLLALLFTSLGQTYNNATRWLVIGPITIMPGEIFKTCCILFFSWFLGYDKNRVNSLKGIFLTLFIMAAGFVMIYKQPNFSTAIIVAALIAGMLYLAGLNNKIVFILVGVILAGLTLVVLYLVFFNPDSYIVDRLTGFTDPFADYLGSGWQVSQGLYALGKGGFTGVGLGNSIQKAFYLPEPMSDFILTIIGEELGFIGIIILMLAYLALLYSIFKVAMRSPDRFGLLFAGGVGLHLGLQVVLNIAVITASSPPTGVALPLVTLGGNALVLFMFELGVVYNISKYTRLDETVNLETDLLNMEVA